jgi:hypothetical protein
VAVRYYVYASDTKIDMLYSQIPQNLLSRFVAELKLDVKVLAVSLKKRETDETLYSKLTVVERYLREKEEIGSIAEPKTWFEGELPLRSGVWRDRILYFQGIQDGVFLALIGSPHHRIGHGDPNQIQQPTGSQLPALFECLEADNDLDSGRHASYDVGSPDVVRDVVRFAVNLTGWPEPSAFLARRLPLEPPVDDDDYAYAAREAGVPDLRRVLVATPLYVALSEK